MRKQNNLLLSQLDDYSPDDNVGKLYDDDEEFARLLRSLIPEFEYPDFSWMTVAQLKKSAALR